MPRARAAAAATGLPETTPDFHLTIGREFALVCAEIDAVDAKARALRAQDLPVVGVVSAVELQLNDREEGMIRALSLLPAQSLAGATIQLAAAIRLFSWTMMDTEPHPEDERAISRLLSSAVKVMADAAKLDPARDGLNALATLGLDAWQGLESRLEQIYPEIEWPNLTAQNPLKRMGSP